MKENNLHTPEGVRDIYNGECASKQIIENKISKVFSLGGYESIQTPTFEYFEVFKEERGTAKATEMFRFFDRSGEMLVVRPDITPSIARCVARYFKEEQGPIRLCYKGNTFRNLSDHQGKAKEITQLGAELINDASVYADAEILAITVACLLETGLTDFQIEIGEVNFFKELVKDASLGEDQIETLRKLIIEKNTLGLENFLDKIEIDDKNAEVLKKLPTMFGAFEKLEEIEALPLNDGALNALNRLKTINSLMRLYGYDMYISFDLGMLRKYDYYTGIIFNAYTYGSGDEVIAGGRYDNLVEQFGKKAPAVGMAVITDRLLTALLRQGINIPSNEEKVILFCDEGNYNKAVIRSLGLKRCNVANVIYTCEENKTKEEIKKLAESLKSDKYECFF